jgi:plasmid stabilization system protein ParE
VSHALIIRPEAEQDMVEGRDWYEGHRAGLGVEFLTAVDDVYYRVTGASVEVIAVQHGSRSPRGWRSRA